MEEVKFQPGWLMEELENARLHWNAIQKVKRMSPDELRKFLGEVPK